MAEETFSETYVADAWNSNAHQWTRDVRAGFDKYRDAYTFPAFLKFMPSVEQCRVIDLGCGEGTNTRRFAGLGGRMTGIDLSENMIAHAKSDEIQAPLGIQYSIQSYTNLSFPDEHFDVALSTLALMDGPDFSAAMREAFRVLKPGGKLCFSILHPCVITSEFEWLKTNDGAYLGFRVGRYFEKSSYDDHWFFSKRPPEDQPDEKFQVPRFPRTMSEYINAVCEAGFRMTKIDEPRPSEEASREHPWLMRWRDHAPLVLFVSAVKAQ